MSFLAIRWIVSKVDIYMYSFRWAFTSFHTKPSSWTSYMYDLERRPKPFSLTIVLKPDFCCILFGKESALSQNNSYVSGVSSEDGVYRRRAAHMFWKNSSLSLYDFEVFEENCDQNSSPFRIERFLYASGLGFWRKKYREIGSDLICVWSAFFQKRKSREKYPEKGTPMAKDMKVFKMCVICFSDICPSIWKHPSQALNRQSPTRSRQLRAGNGQPPTQSRQSPARNGQPPTRNRQFLAKRGEARKRAGFNFQLKSNV